MFGLRKDNRREKLQVLAAFHNQEADKLASVGGELWLLHNETYWLLNYLAKEKKLDGVIAGVVCGCEDSAREYQAALDSYIASGGGWPEEVRRDFCIPASAGRVAA